MPLLEKVACELPLRKWVSVPVMPTLIVLPCLAEVGEHEEMVGAATNSLSVLDVPAAVVTTTGPVVAPEGTIVVITPSAQ